MAINKMLGVLGGCVFTAAVAGGVFAAGVARESSPRMMAARAEEARARAAGAASLAAAEARARAAEDVSAEQADRERESYCLRMASWRQDAARFDRLARWELMRHRYAMAIVWQQRADDLRSSGAPCE